MTPPVPTLVVGGGLMGMSIAYALARRGEAVWVLERETTLRRGASHVAAGMLPSRGETESPEVRALAALSAGMYPAWIRDVEAHSGLPCCYSDSGAVWVAFSREEAQALESMRANWGDQVAALSPSEMLAREPRLSNRVHSGYFVPGFHHVDPRALLASLEEALRRLQVPVHGGCRMREVALDDDGVAGLWVQQDGEERLWPARRVVLAAGAWSSAVDSPYRDLAVRPVKGQLLRLRGPGLLRHLVCTPEVCLVPRQNGELLVGATVEERGFSTAPTAGAMMDLLHLGHRVLPGLRDLEFVECAVSVRPAVADTKPVIGAGTAPGLFVATGHHRNGIVLAPGTAQLLVDYMISGVLPEALQPFAPERLLHRHGTAAPGFGLEAVL